MLSSKALAGTALAVAALGSIGLVYAEAAVLESACIKADKTAAATKDALPSPERCAVVVGQ